MHIEIQEIPSKHKEKLFYCENSQTIKQVAQRGYRVPILGDFQNPIVRGLEQSALAHLALSSRLKQMTDRSIL